MWFLWLLSTFILIFVERSVAEKCVCASENTDVYLFPNQTGSKLGVLSAPSCLPYKNKQVLSYGLRAQVEFGGQDAWLDTSKTYVRSCNEPFSCACAVRQTVFRARPSEKSSAITVPFKTCFKTRGKELVKNGEWTPVSLKHKKPGWVKTQDIAFHDKCMGLLPKPILRDIQLSGCPFIIDRRDWGARKARVIKNFIDIPLFEIVHHSGTAGCSYREECIREVRGIQDFHMDGHGLDDIQFNFLIGGDGTIYQGRGWDIIGQHTEDYNADSLGTCMIGEFNDKWPTQIQLEQLERLFACSVFNVKLSYDYTLLGHRDIITTTTCPGDKLYNMLKSWEHFELFARRLFFDY